jgi:hypothetical protein
MSVSQACRYGPAIVEGLKSVVEVQKTTALVVAEKLTEGPMNKEKETLFPTLEKLFVTSDIEYQMIMLRRVFNKCINPQGDPITSHLLSLIGSKAIMSWDHRIEIPKLIYSVNTITLRSYEGVQLFLQKLLSNTQFKAISKEARKILLPILLDSEAKKRSKFCAGWQLITF